MTTIETSAIYGCTGITSITIPNSVTTIESNAFAYCSGLRNIIVFAITPPSPNNYPFYLGVSNSIPVIVPIGTLESYSFEFCSWSWFTDIRENQIISFADENVKSLCVTNWDTDGDGELSMSESFVVTKLRTDTEASVFESSEIITSFDEFQYFMGLTIIEQFAFSNCTNLSSIIIPNSVSIIEDRAFMGCSGITSITIPGSVTFIGWGAFLNCSGLTAMTVLADTPPTLDDYESPFSGVDMTIPCYVPCGSLEAYQSAAYWSQFTNIQEVCSQIQTFTLAAGTNWISTYVDITLDDMKAALVEALPGTSITIKGKNASTTYNGTTWRGQLNSMDVMQMYKVAVSSACEITLEGMTLVPGEYPVTILGNAANWIAFPLSESITVSEAFAGFPVNGDQVKGKSGSTTFNGTNWRGNLTTLVPGQGYIYQSKATENKTFTFPMGAK